MDYPLEKYREIQHADTSPTHILLFPMQPNVTSDRLSYIEENDILAASIRQVITTINTFNANTNMYAVIEVQRNFHETGLVELKFKTIPFEINLNKEKGFDLHYPSIGFGVAVFLFLSFSAYSQITSTQNGDWSATTTWAGGSVPGASDAVVIAHDVSCASTQSASTLTVNNGKTLTLTKDGALTVASTVTNNGTIVVT